MRRWLLIIPRRGNLTEEPKRDFSLAAATWDDNPGRVALAGAVAKAIAEHVQLSKSMRLLDYGAGTGLVTLGLQSYVGSVVAADSAPGMLEVLDRKIADSDLLNVETILLDLEHDDAPDKHFDVIVSSMTMHHIGNVGEVIRKLAAMLNPGGYLAVADLDLDDGQFHPDPTGVRHNGFDREDIFKIFDSCGLTEVTISTAHTMDKEIAGKGLRSFTVFLAVGRYC